MTNNRQQGGRGGSGPRGLTLARQAGRSPGGFTLLELLVVLVIVGIAMGVVSFNAMPDERGRLHNEAQRVALLMQLARDEAIVRNRAIAFEPDANGYRFLLRDENQWQVLEGDDLLHPRQFRVAPLVLTLTPPTGTDGPLRVTFGREPVDRPFLLTLSSQSASVSIRADGIGHFTVE